MKNNIPSPKGILFDMDGVLLIMTQSSHQSWHQVCQQFASMLGLSPHQLEDALQTSQNAYSEEIKHDTHKQRRDRLQPFETRQEMVHRALEHVGIGDETRAADMVRAYEALRDVHRQLAPSALETLHTFQDRGVPLALISNGNATYQRQKIKQHGLAPFFSIILIEEEFGVAKPDERIFRAALDYLHIKAQEAWMIGDDLALDIEAAQQLGISAIWFDPDRHIAPNESSVHPDRTIHMLPELFHLQ
ncbi:MAG: HAD family hydrolase [Ktedonobacteraceae bacterium]